MAVSDFWANFGNGGIFEEIECTGPEGSLAVDAIEKFLPGTIDSNSLNIGGNLNSLDIKHMDVMQIIKMSLLEYAADNGTSIYEPTVNSDGLIEFVEVGEFPGIEGGAEPYSEIRTFNFVEPCAGVMVTGKKPRPYRYPDPIEWVPIWGENSENKDIYDNSFMRDNCSWDNFATEAYIVFPDPHLSDGTTFQDGITSLLEKTSNSTLGQALNDPQIGPWVKIMGYVRYINPGTQATPETEINRNSNARVFIQAGLDQGVESNPIPEGGTWPSMGTLQKKPTYNRNDENAGCYVWRPQNLVASNGIKIEIPAKYRYETVRGTKKDLLVGISDVFLVGELIDVLWSAPINQEAATKTAPGPDDAKVWGVFSNNHKDTHRLSEGDHYAVVYETNPSLGEPYKDPYIIFADLSRLKDPAAYGDNVDLNIDIESPKDAGTVFKGATVFPISQTQGMLVEQIVVGLDINSPSIIVKDPDGTADESNKGRARRIADGLQYDIAAVAVVDAPPPIAFSESATAAQIINQGEAVKDNDPTTTQNFEDTDIEIAMGKMDGGGGLTLNLSFLETEEQVSNAAKALYGYMNSRGGELITYVYGPNTTVNLGGYCPADNGLVINEVRYSYNDSNSYTISVNCGPYLVGGLTDVSGGPTAKMSENFSGNATILQDLGNHIHYKVRIDGFGERWAINMSPNILRIGDQVSVTIHNNPVED